MPFRTMRALSAQTIGCRAACDIDTGQQRHALQWLGADGVRSLLRRGRVKKHRREDRQDVIWHICM